MVAIVGRIAERGVLNCDVFPQIPRFSAALSHLRKVGRVRLIAVTARIRAATVGNKHKVAFQKIDAPFFAVFHVLDFFRRFLLAVNIEHHVLHVDAVFRFHAVIFKIFLQRLNQTFILIVFRKPKRREIGQSVDMVHVSLQVSLHFQRGIPRMESKHRLPVQPEIALPEIVVEVIADFLILQLFFGRHKQLAHLHRRFLVQVEFVVSVRVFAAVHRSAAKRIVRVGFIQTVIFVQNRKARIFQRGHVSEHFPHHFEVVVHFSAAAHIKPAAGHRSSVARAARYIQLFQQVNMLAFHLSVAHKEERRGKPRQSRADDIRRFPVHAFRLHGMSKRFIIS